MNKYRNKRTQVDGIWFDSKAEAKRYAELRLLEKAGEIWALLLQPEFPLHVMARSENTKQVTFPIIGKYVADFEYMEGGTKVVEDVKSPATAKNALFRWKRKHFEAEYGIKLTLIGV